MRKGWRERRKEGMEEASGGRREQRSERERVEREERGRKGDREVGKLQGRYPEEDHQITDY